MQVDRRHTTVPGKPRLTSAAKGIASPAIVRLARRAGCRKTGSSSSTEAHQSNPARFVCETSNPDVLSDAIYRPRTSGGDADRPSRRFSQQGRHRTKRVRRYAQFG